EGISLFVEKYLFDGEPSTITGWFRDVVYGARIRPPCWFEVPGRFSADHRALLEDWCADMNKAFPKGVPEWDPETRGGLEPTPPAARDSYKRLLAYRTKPEWMTAELKRENDSSDMTDLDFCANAGDELRRSVAALAQVSRQVVVVVSPMLGKRSPVGRA